VHPRRVKSDRLLDAVYPSLGSSLGLHFDTQGDVPPRTGNRHAGLAEAPYNVYPALDGHIAILCVSEKHWRSLLQVMSRDDLADDPRFASMAGRVKNIEAVDATISKWTQARDKQDLFEALMAHRVPCAPVRNLSEVVNDPHLHERGMLQWQDHPELGRIVVQHSPLRFAGDPQRPLEPSRTLGADTGGVLEERLGLTPAQVAGLAGRGVV